jgi:hypothetical protein
MKEYRTSFINRSTNEAAESLNAKLKFFRASVKGVVDMRFFLFRIAKIYALKDRINMSLRNTN